MNFLVLLTTLKEIAIQKLKSIYTYLDIIATLPVQYFIESENRIKPLVLCIKCLKIYRVSNSTNFVFQLWVMSVINRWTLVRLMVIFFVVTEWRILWWRFIRRFFSANYGIMEKFSHRNRLIGQTNNRLILSLPILIFFNHSFSYFRYLLSSDKPSTM